MILEYTSIILILCMGLTIIRAITGPSAYDRILAANVFGTQTVIFVVILSFINNNFEYIDVAMIYALINFIATIAFLKYFKYGSFRD